MRGARELAVMTSVSHPNIVQVYSYCTRVVVQQSPSGLPYLEPVPEGSPAPGPLSCAIIMEWCDMGSLADAIDSGAFARYAKAAAAALVQQPAKASSRAVLSAAWDRTDRASLVAAGSQSANANAIGAAGGTPEHGGAAGGGGGSGVSLAGTAAMRAVYLTLLEVALALRHLHALQLVHCDVKPANVLLRSSATDPRGFNAKLADFGFVNVLEVQQQEDELAGLSVVGSAALKAGGGGSGGGAGEVLEAVPPPRSGDAARDVAACAPKPSLKSFEPVGTVTHMAPELFMQGSTADQSVDIYAFGILMWEMYTGRAPFADLANDNFAAVPPKVVREGLRPRFPPDTPLHYKLLAQACWSSQPARRPPASQLVAKLQVLLDMCCGATVA